MTIAPRRLLRVLVPALAALLLGGCITAKKYKLAKEGTLPAKTFDWKNSTPEADLVLQTVIVFKGPGSWKREARWDEYQIAITNQGTAPLVINAAELTDLQGTPQVPGVDPWVLEKMSYTNWDKYGRNGLKLLAGAGAVALYGGAVVGTAAAGLMSGTAATSGAAATLNIIPVVAIVDITAVAIMNHHNKKKVAAEFERRRLVLPLTMAPGDTAKGSLFFPMTPGPRHLTLKGESGGKPVELVMELKALAGLHLAAVAKK